MKFCIIISFKYILILQDFKIIIGNLLFIRKNNIRIGHRSNHFFLILPGYKSTFLLEHRISKAVTCHKAKQYERCTDKTFRSFSTIFKYPVQKHTESKTQNCRSFQYPAFASHIDKKCFSPFVQASFHLSPSLLSSCKINLHNILHETTTFHNREFWKLSFFSTFLATFFRFGYNLWENISNIYLYL